MGNRKSRRGFSYSSSIVLIGLGNVCIYEYVAKVGQVLLDCCWFLCHWRWGGAQRSQTGSPSGAKVERDPPQKPPPASPTSARSLRTARWAGQGCASTAAAACSRFTDSLTISRPGLPINDQTLCCCNSINLLYVRGFRICQLSSLSRSRSEEKNNSRGSGSF